MIRVYTVCHYICIFWMHKPQMSCLMTKQTKWPLRPVKTQISLGIGPVWSVFAVRMKKYWVLSYPLSALRRLGRCPGWSEFSRGNSNLRRVTAVSLMAIFFTLFWYYSVTISPIHTELTFKWSSMSARDWSIQSISPESLQACFVTRTKWLTDRTRAVHLQIEGWSSHQEHFSINQSCYDWFVMNFLLSLKTSSPKGNDRSPESNVPMSNLI